MKIILSWWDQYRYKGYVLGIVVLFILSLVVFLLWPEEGRKDEVVQEELTVKPVEQPTTNEQTTIKVDIKGAIVKPGLYELEAGSRVQDVIEKSGGLNVDADTSMINLSKLLEDEMVIIIYTKDEIRQFEEGNTAIKYIEKECICPTIENDGCIDQNHVETNEPSAENTNTKISLNRATLQELLTLPGIGEVKAQAIIDYRQENGNFNSIDELKNVKGIGDSTFEKLKDYITI